MRQAWAAAALLCCLLSGPGQSLPDEPDKTYAKLYEWGVGSYTDERWYECVAFLQRALEDWRWWKGIGTHCRHKCSKKIQVWAADKPPDSELAFMDRVIRKSLCLERCVSETGGYRPAMETDPELEAKFRRGFPYSYIQMCYWKMGELEKAVGAAFTFLTKNPEDKMMQENLFGFYAKESGFRQSWLLDLDEYSYQSLYVDGTKAYEEEDFAEAAKLLSQAVDAYLEHFEDRRVWCEDVFPTPSSGPGQLYSHIGQAYIAHLACLVNISAEMDHVRGGVVEDLLPSLYHYLQFAYYKEGQVQAACEAVGTFLLFFPDHATMLKNKAFYKKKYQLVESFFRPAKKVKLWLARRRDERHLFDFAKERFAVENGAMTSEHPDDWKLIEDYEDENEESDSQSAKAKPSDEL